MAAIVVVLFVVVVVLLLQLLLLFSVVKNDDGLLSLIPCLRSKCFFIALVEPSMWLMSSSQMPHLALPLLALCKEKWSQTKLLFVDMMIDDLLQMITTWRPKLAINHNTCHAWLRVSSMLTSNTCRKCIDYMLRYSGYVIHHWYLELLVFAHFIGCFSS